MSATYKLIGKRNLRKYTAPKTTPVYAAEPEVSYLSRNLCNVPWNPVSPKDASMTYHTNDIVYQPNPESAGVSGLDYNVMIRDGFDAALFCGGHVNETHRVYGNAACYKFTLPDMQTYPMLEKLKVNVTSDPYNSTGARIAIYTNSTGVIPTECETCRQGSAPSQSHSCTKAQGSNDWTTNDTYADAVAPREARQTTSGGKTSTSWYPVSGTCEFNPTGGLQLQKYLFVFVLLENYNVCRGNWIEGCSFIENLVTLTTSSAVTGWTNGGTVDCSTEVSPEFTVYSPNASFVSPASSKAYVFETVCGGCDEPTRSKLVDASDHGDFVSLDRNNSTGSQSVSSRTAYSGKLPCMSISGCVYFTTKPISYGISSSDIHNTEDLYVLFRMIGRYAVKYVGGTTGNIGPGLNLMSKYVSGYRSENDPPNEAAVAFSNADVVANKSSATGVTAYSLLQSGDVNDVVMLWGSSFMKTNGSYDVYTEDVSAKRVMDVTVFGINGGASQSTPVTEEVLNYYVPVAVCSSTGMFILGFVEIPVAFCSVSSTAAVDTLPQCRFLYSSGAIATTNVAGVTDVITATGHPDTSYHFRLGLTVSSESSVASLDTDALGRLSSSLYFIYREIVDNGIVLRYSGGGMNPVYVQGTGISVRPSLMCSKNKKKMRYGAHIGQDVAGIAVDICGNITSVNGTSCESGFVSVIVSQTVSYSSGTTVITTSGRFITADAVLSGHIFSGGPVKDVAVVGLPSSGSATFIVSGGFSSVDGTAYPGICKITYSSGTSTVGAVISGNPSGFTAAEERGVQKALYAWKNFDSDYNDLCLMYVVQADSTSGLDIYSTTPYDSILSSDSAAERVCGLRNCFGKVYQSAPSSSDSVGSSTGASFQVTKTSKSVAVISVGASGYSKLTIPVWRISATPFLIPFSLPSETSVSKVNVSWTSYQGIVTNGVRCTAWVRFGERLTSIPDEFLASSLFTGDSDTVGIWSKLGSFVPTSSSGSVSIPFTVPGGTKVATILLMAWFPQDSIAYQTFSSPVGLGSVSYSVDGKLIGVSNGFKPTVSLV